ncbi:MAG TPA: hypothetical protein PLN52_21145, partial [Opitutaceae bacterium]|nr:hypothetical protein [Opitutaceae bacterium]
LARAAPSRTVKCFEKYFSGLEAVSAQSGGNEIVSDIEQALRELIFDSSTHQAALRLQLRLAVRDPWAEPAPRCVSNFCECFVYWLDVPMTLRERADWLEQLLHSSNSNDRALAVRALHFATSIPETLSGFSVTARKLGIPPPAPLWIEVFDYLERLFAHRFELLGHPDPEIAALMNKDLLGALIRAKRSLRLDRFLRLFERYMELYRNGKVCCEPAEIKHTLDTLIEDFAEAKSQDQKASAPKWDAFIARIEVHRDHCEGGPFLVRLKLAADRINNYKEVHYDGRKMFGFEAKARTLAKEAIANPSLMSEEVWAVVEGPAAFDLRPFVAALGEYDLSHGFLARFANPGTDRSKQMLLADYLAAVRTRDPIFADQTLDRLVATPSFPTTGALFIVDRFGPSPENRRRVVEWITAGTVDPQAVADVLGRRWLDHLPPEEVRFILEFVFSRAPNGSNLVVKALTFYLHPGRALPPELVPLALRALDGVDNSAESLSYECSQVGIAIAKTNPDAAYPFFVSRAGAQKGFFRKDWNPLGRHGSRDFWDFLRDTNPERAYRALLEIPVDSRDDRRPVTNLERHADVLMGIARDGENTAATLVAYLDGLQPGFFTFCFRLLDQYPASVPIRTALTNAALRGDGRFSFGTDRYADMLSRVDTLLADPAQSAQHLSWLRAIKVKIEQEAESAKRAFGPTEAPLGWD